MSNVYTCIQCDTRLVPEFMGAAIRQFWHGLSDGKCLNEQKFLPRGSDQVKVEDLPVKMSGRELSYPRAGLIRYFQCQNDPAHADYYRGEITSGRERSIWKRCPTCGGEMILTSVRLHSDGSVDPYVPFQRDPDAEVEIKGRLYMPENELLRKYLRKVPRRFRRSKTSSAKSMELYLRGDKPYRRRGTVFTRKVLVIADVDTQTVSVYMYGCAGWSSDFKRAGNLTGIPLDVIIKPSAVSARKSKKGAKRP